MILVLIQIFCCFYLYIMIEDQQKRKNSFSAAQHFAPPGLATRNALLQFDAATAANPSVRI